MSDLRILFIGMPDMALVCLDELMRAGKNVVGIVPSPLNDPSYWSIKQHADYYKIPLINHNNDFLREDFLEQIRNLNPDIAIVASFNKKLPKEMYSIPRLGTINCHPSLLPDYRGGNPYFHVINNGERETGVTYHYMDEDFDTGDIVSQIKVPIYPTDTMGILFNRLNFYSAKQYVAVINMFEENENPPRMEQPKEGDFKSACKIYTERGDNVINWDTDASSIEKFIRALNPFYGAITYYKGICVKIWAGKNSNNINVSNVEPGTVLKVTDKLIMIATKNGVYMPEILQFGSYMVSDVKDFISLTKIRKDDRFTS